MKYVLKFIKTLNIKNVLLSALGGAILGFGLREVHSISGVTEGGGLGLTLILDYWFHISPAVSGFIISSVCYLIGLKTFGFAFIAYSMVSAGSFSLAYGIAEQFEPLWPELANMPLVSAIIGAVFVGVGVGVCVRAGGAPTGDDALAMSLSRVFNAKIEWMYMISDLTVLGLSLTYIPFKRIIFSLLTVILSGQIIGVIQRMGTKKKSV
ncbi:MAG: YitT family protein [Clostridia bacterium]|nr:YitT family protein [Clostridia bacterium]